MKSVKVFTLINNICNGNYSPTELTEFVNLSHKIAISYLKYQEVIGKNIRPKNAEGLNDLEDVAMDCIAGLFMRNEDDEFVQLKRYFEPILTVQKNRDDDTLMMMLRRLVVKKTKQELSRIFRERDPEGAKIIRNIRVAIRNSGNFCSFREMGREFVFLRDLQQEDQNFRKDLRRDLAEIPGKLLFQQFLDQYSPNDSVSGMMKKMLSIVTKTGEYQDYLPIDVLANIIRDVTFQQFREQVTKNVDTSSPFQDFQVKEVNEVNKVIIKFVHNKIKNQYLKKNKIDALKAEIYFKAIRDFVYDLTHAKECESNFKYLKRYIPDLTQRAYREEERSIFEYLVKITKKSLRKKLKDLL
ncbi:hypothetical protein GF337_02060 [candidate division KSB1 bacterium]|nr:hypothetical protein [candidate division KSB1 bacterium]